MSESERGILGTGIRVYFPALKSALIDQPKAPKHQSSNEYGALEDEMVLKVIEIIRNQPDISQESIGNQLGISRRIVQKYISGSSRSISETPRRTSWSSETAPPGKHPWHQRSAGMLWRSWRRSSTFRRRI